MVSSIPEIAMQLIDKTLSYANENNTRTVFLIGSKGVGKSTLIHLFLEKTDAVRETLVVDYSFGRKSNQKQGIDKTLCHFWEYGGKLETLDTILPFIAVKKNNGFFFYCVMVDLSKIKVIWETLEICVQAMHNIATTTEKIPELIFIGGKYDIFKNYDNEVKKFICTTLRSFALLNNAHLMFYSSKEPQLLRRAKDMLYNIAFGNCIPIKEKNTNFLKPLFIPKGVDSWESIGVPSSSLEQLKIRHLSRIPPAAVSEVTTKIQTQQQTYPEPVLDLLVSSRYNELRSLNSMNIPHDYLPTI